MENNKKVRKLMSLCLIGCLLTSCASRSVTGRDFQSYKNGDRKAAEKIAENMELNFVFSHEGHEYKIYYLEVNSSENSRMLVYVDGKLAYVNKYYPYGYSKEHMNIKYPPLYFPPASENGLLPMENGFADVVNLIKQENILSEPYIAKKEYKGSDIGAIELVVGVPVVVTLYAAAAAVGATVMAPLVPFAIVQEVSTDSIVSNLEKAPIGSDAREVKKEVGKCDKEISSKYSNYQICEYRVVILHTQIAAYAGFKDSKLVWKKVGGGASYNFMQRY